MIGPHALLAAEVPKVVSLTYDKVLLMNFLMSVFDAFFYKFLVITYKFSRNTSLCPAV